MDGTIANLKDIVYLGEKYDALVFIDECHGTGVVGENGIGSAEYYGVLDKVDLISSTLGKSLGSSNGGFLTGNKELIEYLR